jgi:hypothetical protein
MSILVSQQYIFKENPGPKVATGNSGVKLWVLKQQKQV